MPERKDWIPGGRKYSLCILTWAGATVLKATGMLDDGSYVAIVLGIAGAYVTGNVVQDYRPPREGGQP